MRWARGEAPQPTAAYLLVLPKARYTEEHQEIRTWGACNAPHVSVALFYSDTPADQAHAKAICATCPVEIECYDLAVKNSEQGIWGGATEGERRSRTARLRQRRLRGTLPENYKIAGDG